MQLSRDSWMMTSSVKCPHVSWSRYAPCVSYPTAIPNLKNTLAAQTWAKGQNKINTNHI